LPEYQTYIEEYGFPAYYHLLDVLEQKLPSGIPELLDGKAADAATLKWSVEIISAAPEMISAVQELRAEAEATIPESLRGPQVPSPPRVR
jgi:hypothetical protein